MKTLISKLYILALLPLVWLAVGSCKKKYDQEFIGPELKSGNAAKLLEPLDFSVDSIDFFAKPEITLKAKLDQPVNWLITIEGKDSYATKTFAGFSDTIHVKWNGVQDSLYYFRDKEACVASLRLGGSNMSAYGNDPLKIRGEMKEAPVVGEANLFIKRKKRDPKGQVVLFPYKPIFTNNDSELEMSYYVYGGISGYDAESRTQVEFDPKFIKYNEDLKFPYSALDDKSFLTYSKGGQAITSSRFFILKGTDRVSNITNKKDLPDYYIGRLSTPNFIGDGANQYVYGRYFFNNPSKDVKISDSLKGKSPSQVYLNVFVYGNGDGSKINYTIKEDEFPDEIFKDEQDEAFEYPIVVDFKGWKKFSIPYSEFTYVPYKDPTTGEEEKSPRGNNKKLEPERLIHVQFGLVAPKLGASGLMIIDNPILSWDGPMKY